MIGDFHEAMCDAAGLEFDGPDVHGCDGCDEACGFHPEPDRVYFSRVEHPATWEPTGCPIIYPPSIGLRLQRLARQRLARLRFEERLMRLDPLLWAPPLVPAKLSRRDVDPLYDEYRAANRPFRRAFPGGELRRKHLLAVGQSNAQRKEAQS